MAKFIANGIKFNRFNVRQISSGLTCKVLYSLDNRVDRRKCVTLYARDYDRSLGNIFKDVAQYKNDTDIMTDYFDQGRVVIFETDAVYPVARAAAKFFIDERAAKFAAKREAA